MIAKFRKILLASVVVAVAALMLLPIVLTLLYSLMGKNELNDFMTQVENSVSGFIPLKILPDKIDLYNYYEILMESVKFNMGYWNSVYYAFAITLGQIILGTGAAFVFSKFKFRGRNVLFFVYVTIMMMPFQVTLVPNYIALRVLNLLDRGSAIILPGIFSAFGVFILRQFMLNISDSLIEAAQIDGANTFVIFGKIILPLVKTGLVALFVLSFIDTWNMVEQPLIFLKNIKKMPLSILIRAAMDRTGEIVMPVAVLYMVPAILIYFIFKESLIEGITKSWLNTSAERSA